MSITVVFFGTGSSRPMPHRNVSGLALVRDGASYLFDCGENTQVQMMGTGVRPGSINGIFLSHFHGDHVNGLPGLLASLGSFEREAPLPVYAPKGLKQWFALMHRLHILRSDRFTLLNEISEHGIVFSHPEFDIIATPLKHRIECYGYALVEHDRPGRFDIERAKSLKIPPGPLYGKLHHGEAITLPDGRTIEPHEVVGPARPGLKIAYCTDTQPCEATIELARGADLLIHEATYPPGMEAEAHTRGHSTAIDAATIARKAGVRQLILTHFSQKFPYQSPFLYKASEIFPHIKAATDKASFEVKRREG